MACGAASDGVIAARTEVAWTDSVRLQESDSLFVADPAGIAVHPDGRLLVSDVVGAKVVVFGPDGSALRVIGRRGRGPGEFAAPSVVEVLDDSTIAVLDASTARVSRFHIDSGAFVFTGRLPGPAIDMRRSATGLWVAAPQVATGHSFAWWDLAADTMALHGTMPAPYTRFPRLRRNLGLGALAETADGVWVGMLGSNALEFYPQTDLRAPSRSVEVPRLRRRGVPLDKPELLDAEVSYEEEVQSASMLMSISQLSDGRLATVHQDFTIEGQSLRVAAFLSVIDAASGSGCIDVPLPIASEVAPLLRLIGDRLYFVQAVADGEESVTWVKSIRVSSLRC
jgi:hypothetical protein